MPLKFRSLAAISKANKPNSAQEWNNKPKTQARETERHLDWEGLQEHSHCAGILKILVSWV